MIMSPPILRNLPLTDLPANETLIAPKPTKAFLESIRAVGILYPILMVKNQVVDGRNRIKAARSLDFSSILALIYPEGSEIEKIQVIANNHRRANPASDLEAIEKMKRRNFTDDEIPLALGISKQLYRQRCQLFKLLSDFRTMLTLGELPIGTATKLAKLKSEEQRVLLKLYATQGKLTQSDIKALLETKKKTASQNLPDNLFEEVKPASWQLQATQLLTKLQETVPPHLQEQIQVLSKSLL